MKTLLLLGLIALTSSVHAIPPAGVDNAPQMVCKDLNDLTIAEIDSLNDDAEKIFTVSPESNEICFEKDVL